MKPKKLLMRNMQNLQHEREKEKLGLQSSLGIVQKVAENQSAVAQQ